MLEKNRYLWLFFGFSGRVSRLAYFLAGLLVALAQGFPLYRLVLEPEHSASAQMWSAVFGVMYFLSLWCSLTLSVKRLHDIDKPGILAVALFIPVVSIAAFLLLCLIPGTPGANRYGSITNAPR